MKKAQPCLIALFFLALLTPPLYSRQPQQQPQKSASPQPPKPVPSSSQEVLDSWNEIGRKLIAQAEDFPEDEYDFRPVPEVRTFAEVLLHVVGTSYVFTDAANGKVPRPHDLNRKDYPAKSDIVAVLKKAFQEGAEAIRNRGDAGMVRTVRLDFNNQMIRLSDLAYSMAMHASEHYGQLVVYFRLNGFVPPESRTP